MLKKLTFKVITGVWRTSLLYRGHWILFLSCFIAASLSVLLLVALKTSFPVTKEKEKCSSRPFSLMTSGIDPFLEEIICGSESGCNPDDQNFPLFSFPPITERIANDDKLLDFMKNNNPTSIHRRLTKNLAQLEKFVKTLERQPTLNDAISVPYQLRSSVNDYDRLRLVTEERLSINLTEATEAVLLKLNLKQILSGIPRNLSNYFIFDARTLGEFVTLSDDLTFRLNNLTVSKYDLLKCLYKVLYDHLDWRSIYQKVNHLSTYSMETQLTPKNIESLQAMIGSFSHLEKLRSLLGIFYSAKLSLEAFSDARKALNDTGWNDKEISELVAYFLELNEEGILEKYFPFSKENSSKKKEKNAEESLLFMVLRSIRFNLLGNFCSNPQPASTSSESYHFLTYMKAIQNLSGELSAKKVTFGNILTELSSALDAVVLFKTDETILFDECDIGSILADITQNLNSLDFGKIFYGVIEYIIVSPEKELGEEFAQIFRKFGKSLFSSPKNLGSNDEGPVLRFQSLAGQIAAFWNQLVTSTRKIFPESWSDDGDNNYMQRLIAHPILMLKPSNALQVIGDLVTTEIVNYFLKPKIKLDESCQVNNSAEFASDLKCSIKKGFGQKFTSPFFEEIFQVKSLSDSPNIINAVKNSFETLRFIQKYINIEKIHLLEIKQFLEIWSSKTQWEILEENLNLYHQSWIYSFMDSLIPQWNKSIANMLSKLTDLAVYMQLFIEEVHKFVVSDQVVYDALQNFTNLNGSWDLGLLIIYNHVRDHDEALSYDDICGVKAKIAPFENLTLDEFEGIMKDACSLNLKAVSDAVKQFDKNLDRKLRETATPTGTFHLKLLVDYSHKAYDEWLKLRKSWNESNAKRLLKLSFNSCQEILLTEGQDSSVKTNINFIHTMFELLRVNNYSSRVQKKISPDFLHKTNLLRQLFATNAEGLLQGTPELYNFQDIILNVVPQALRESVVFISARPRMVSILHPLFLRNVSTCEANLSLIGENTEKVQSYFCNFPTDTLTFEIEKIMSINAFKKSYNEKSDSAILKLLNLTMKNLQTKFEELLNEEELNNDSIKILNFSNWNKIFDTILNVSVDEMYDNGALIWAQTMLPLVTESRSGKPKSEKLRDILLIFDGLLREVKLCLGLLAGGDLWTSLKNSYEDKIKVIQLFDYIEKSPQLVTHILEYHGNHPTFLVDIFQLNDFQSFCSLLLKLAEEGNFDQPDQWKEFFDFFCTQESRDILLNQLNPRTLPMIGNQIVTESDAAVLGLLLDGVSWDLFLLQRKYFFEGNIQVPDWIRPFHWIKAKELCYKIMERGLADHLTVSLLLKENYHYNVRGDERSSAMDDNSAKFQKIGEIIGLWINELEGSNENASTSENINLDNVLNVVVLITGSEVMHQYLIGDSMEEILKYTCHKSNLSNASLFVCNLIRVGYFDLYERPDEETNNYREDPTAYTNLRDKIHKIISDSLNLNESHVATQERLYKVFKVIIFLQQQLYVSLCSDIDKCIFQIRLMTQIMNYIIDVDTIPYTSENSSFEIVKDAMNKVLKVIVTKKKGGKWVNSDEELLHRSQNFFLLFDEFSTSFVNLAKDVLIRFTTKSFSPKQIKVLGFLEVITETIWKYSSDRSLRNLIMEFSYEIEANEKALSFLSEVIALKLETTQDKNGLQFIQQILKKDSPIKLIRNSTEELDGIVTALLFFNEAVDSALFNELESSNFVVSKISEGKLFVLRSLSESSIQMIRLSKEFIPESTLHKNLLKIQNGLDILLHKKEMPETIKKNVLKDMIHNESELKRKLKTLQVPDNLINGLLFAEVDLNMFQVIIDRWYHTVSTVCEQLTTNKNLNKNVTKHINNNNSNVSVICSKLRSVDFPLILLSQLNLSSVFYQIENFTLNELFNSSKESLSTFRDAYSQSYHFSDNLKQLRRIMLSLTKISGVTKSLSNESENEMLVLHKLRTLMCLNNETISSQENQAVDLCSKLLTTGSGGVQQKWDSMLNGKIVISPENHLTRSLVKVMRKYFGGNVERTLTLLKHLKQHLKEECKLSLKKPLLNLPSKILQHKWAQTPVESVLSVNLNHLKALSEDTLQYCKDVDRNNYEFENVIDFLLNFTSCFRNERFELTSREDFRKRTEEMTRENRLLAGIEFNQFKKGTNQSDSEEFKFILKVLPTRRNLASSNIMRKWYGENSFGGPDELISIQKEISLLQYMVENSLRKLTDNDKKNFTEQKEIAWNTPSTAGNAPVLNKSRKSKRESQNEQNQGFTDLPKALYAYGTSYGCYSQNAQYYDSIIGSSIIGIFICSIVFVLFGIFLIHIFVEDSGSISPELKIVYSIDYVSSNTFLLTFAVLTLTIMMCLMTTLLKLLNVLPHTSVLVTMALIFVFGINVIVISHILSALFVSKTSSVISFMTFMIVGALPYPLIFAQEGTPSHLALIIMNILPPSGFCYGLRSVHQYEIFGIGASYSNLWILPTQYNEISLALGLILQLFGFFILCFLDLLVNFVFKNANFSDSGDKFLNFKILHQNIQRETTSRVTSRNDSFPIFQDQFHTRVSIHPTPGGIRTLKVVGLQKLTFHEDKTMIIGENISFETYENQIFALFGPTKSGKTTVMSMIAGVVQPSSGHICIYEEADGASRDSLRKTISFCPKILKLPILVTVKECLMFFGYIKAIKNFKKVQQEVDSLIIELKLENWQHVLLRDVPDAIQKFVAVATSLVGGSKIIVLDEPTHQIPYSLKRTLLKVLSNYRKERTILVATSDPEIVEHLADVISVIDKGKLLFIGSKKGLMEDFSPGYGVIINNRLDDRPLPQQEEFEELLEELFQEYFPNASFMDFDNEDQEIKFNIPYQVAQLHPESFCFLLRDLEVRKEELGVSYVEVTHPTMSKILKAVLQQGDTFRQEALLTPEREEIHKRNFNFKNTSERTTFRLRASAFRALLNKRMLHNIRNKFFYLQSILIPVLFIILSMHCLWIPPDEDSQKEIETSSSYINQGIYLLPSNSTSWTRRHESHLENLLLKSEGSEKDETFQEEKCQKEKVQINILWRNKLSCNAAATQILNYTSCICKNKRCLMKIANPSNRSLFVPFNKRHFRVLPDNVLYDDAISNNQHDMVLYFDVDDVTSLPSMVTKISKVREDEEGAFPNSSQNLNFVSSFQFIHSGNDINGDKFSSVHLLATTLFGILLLTALTIGVVSSAMQMLGEKSQLSVIRAAGVSKLLYISSFIVWDTLIILMISFFAVTIASIYYVPHVVAGSHLSALFLLASFYGSSMLPVSYIYQDVFVQEESLAVKILCFCCIGTAAFASALVYFCNEFGQIKAISTTGHYLHRVFLSFPPYVFVSGVKSIYFIYSKNQDLISSEQETYLSPYVWNSNTDLHIGVHLMVFSVWICSGYVFIVFSNLWNYCNKKFVSNTQNSEVGFPGVSSVTSLHVSNMSFEVKGPMKKRVELNFRALNGECLMIYGENPIENTLILRHLIGEISPLDGVVKRFPAEVPADGKTRLGELSYGSHEPALDELLTTEEELQLFSQLRGFYSNDLYEIVHRALCSFNLISVKNFKIKDLSKETRRRICLAKTAIGNPKIIILDDPFRESSVKFNKLIQEVIRSATNAFDSVIISSSSLDDMNELTKQLIFYEDGKIIQMGKMNQLQSSLRRKYLVKIQTHKLEDVKEIIRKLEIVETLQITEVFHTTVEAKFSCDVSPFSIFGAISKARGVASFWYEVSSLTLSQFQRGIAPALSREPSPDTAMVGLISPQIPTNGNISLSELALPVFEGRESRDSFYDNQNDDDLIQPNKFNLSPRIRRGSHGSAKLTPCSTPLPPRSPAGYRTSFEKLTPTDPRKSVDRRSSTERSVICESPFKLQKPKKIKRRAGIPMEPEGPSCSYHPSFDMKEPRGPLEEDSRTPNLLESESTGSQLLMEKFLENLPTVKTTANQSDPKSSSPSNKTNEEEHRTKF